MGCGKGNDKCIWGKRIKYWWYSGIRGEIGSSGKGSAESIEIEEENGIEMYNSMRIDETN